MVTIREVAKRAGVAPITVSRVINDSGYVSAETRRRVEAAVVELGYIPNRLASGLRFRHTQTVALVLTDITNPFWTVVARGVEDAASEAGFTVILCNTDESEAEEERYLRMLVQRRVDGVLLVPARSTTSPLTFIHRQAIPAVVLDRRVAEATADVVRCDSEGGAYQLVRHMLDLGHRRIAILTGPRDVSTATDRVRGYRRALEEAGIRPRDAWILYGTFTLESGYAMVRSLLGTSPRPTGILGANNFIAIGALRALRDAQLRVPEDVSLVGFDDLPSTLVVDPFLTVAAQPAYAMGQRATEVLLARIRGTGPEAFEEAVLPTQIIVRGSSGPPGVGEP